MVLRAHYPRIISVIGSKMRLGIMDNGNNRVDSDGQRCGTSRAPACYSRSAVFDIHESARTATPVWEYRPGFYSSWGGSTEILPNGDVEAAFSQSRPFGGPPGSRIVEVTPGTSPHVVWQLDVLNESAYRGFRVPSLYPGVQW